MLVMFTRALRRRFPVLANRNFRLLLADRLVAPMAATFSLVGVSFAVLAATGSTADLSYVIAAQAAPSLVFLLIGGVIADRIALFYPASMALLPRLVSAGQMREASAISRLTMNAAMMAGAALAGECVALFGAGWALAVCGVGMLGTVPLLLTIRVAPLERSGAAAGHEHAPSMFRELREGWSEFRSHTWLWSTVLQFTVVLAAWCGGFQVLGPAVARAHLGGPAAWGLISAAEATGLIVGGIVALRWAPSRPTLFVVLTGGAVAFSPLSLAMLLPLWVVCVTSFALGVAIEALMVVWTVTMATKIPADKLARVSAYDALGTTMGMPAGALVAGPLAARFGVSATQYGAAAITLVATALALIPREVWTMRSGPEPIAAGAPAADDAVIVAEPVLAGAALADASTR